MHKVQALGRSVERCARHPPLVRALSVAIMPALATLIVCCSITSCSCGLKEAMLARRALLRITIAGRTCRQQMLRAPTACKAGHVDLQCAQPGLAPALPCCGPRRSSCQTRQCSRRPCRTAPARRSPAPSPSSPDPARRGHVGRGAITAKPVYKNVEETRAGTDEANTQYVAKCACGLHALAHTPL